MHELQQEAAGLAEDLHRQVTRSVVDHRFSNLKEFYQESPEGPSPPGRDGRGHRRELGTVLFLKRNRKGAELPPKPYGRSVGRRTIAFVTKSTPS